METGQLAVGNPLNASFFLTSSDNVDLNKEPRGCDVLRRVKRQDQEDGLLVRVEPPLQGGLHGTEDKPIGVVVLANRHAGQSLLAPREWPVFVYVARPLLDDTDNFYEVTAENAVIVAWGDVYPSKEEARNAYYAPLHEA